MTKNELAPVPSSERLDVIDALRGLAVCGILVGNMQWFSGYGMMPPVMQADFSQVDKVVQFLVHFLVEGKFYSIFSFLFGFGFALQIARAEERGDAKATLFKRRLFWMLVIGLLHAYLIWAGDIVSVYALVGFVLLLFRKKSDQSLLKWAAWLIVVPVVTYAIIYILFRNFVPPDAIASFESMQATMWENNLAAVTQSNYFQIISGFNLNYIVGRYAGLILQMRLPKILAMFLLGMYAYRLGGFQNLAANRDRLKRIAVSSFFIGIAANLAFAVLAGNEGPMPPTVPAIIGVAAYAVGVPALAIFIISAVALLWQKAGWQRLLSFLAPVGRMALTNYILQSVICVIIFYGYGFGNYGKVGPTTATLIAFAIFPAQIVLSMVWLRFFRFGPLEWIWRQLTYKQRLDLVR